MSQSLGIQQEVEQMKLPILRGLMSLLWGEIITKQMRRIRW